MTDAVELPRELWVRETLQRLIDAAAHAARDQTTDDGLVEDAASEAIQALVIALRAPTPPTPVTWERYVRTAATNYARRHDRRARRAELMGRAGTDLGGAGHAGDRGGNAVVEAALGQLGRAGISTLVAGNDHIERLLDGLRPQARALLVGKYVDGLSTAELAVAHGLSEKSVENRLRYARQRLAAQL